MVDLSVNFAGLELKNPLVVASGPTSCDIRQIKEAERCGASAVILKGIRVSGDNVRQSNLRCYIDRKAGALYGVGGGRVLTFEEGMELVRTAKRETTVKVGANIFFFRFEDRERCADMAQKLAKAGADFIELNFSPQIPVHLFEERAGSAETPGEGAGRFARDLPVWALEGTRLVRQAVNVPVIGKIEPEAIEVVTVARAMESGGADGIDAINAPNGAFQIDIFDGGRLKMPAAESCTLTFCGAPLKPIAQAAVARISKAVKVPVMGTGGLMNWRDAVEMMMFGATTVSFCTLLMIHGFEAMARIEKELRKFMEQQGYSHVSDFRGLALRSMAESRLACKVIPSVARIAGEKCTGCGICLKPAHCLAITMDNGTAVVHEEECLGCGTCFLVCPAQAVSMVRL